MTEPTDAAGIGRWVAEWIGGVRDATRNDTGATEQRIETSVERLGHAVVAAIAKFGTPAVAGEPVAWWIPKAEQFCLADKSGDRPFAKAWEPLYAAPQPTQSVPPAGREPLTEDQRSDIATAAAGFNWTDDYVEAIDYVIDGVELHHGIKGGQHGVE